MTLVEIVISLGIVSVVCLAMSSIINSTYSSYALAEGKSAYLETVLQLQDTLKRSTFGNTQKCSTFIEFPSGAFSATGSTPVKINLGPNSVDQYMSGTVIGSTGSQFRVDQIYFDNKNLIGSTSGATATFYYSANLNIEASLRQNGNWIKLPRKTIANTTLKFDSGMNLQECNVATVENAQALCESVQGMTWASAAGGSGSCVKAIDRNPANGLYVCPPGSAQDSSGNCLAASSACSYNELPGTLDSGVVSSCASVPVAYSVNYPPSYHPPNAPPPNATGQVVSSSPGGGAAGLPPAPTPPPPTTCACGASTIAVGSTTQFCGTSRRVGNEIGGWPDLAGDVEVTVYSCGTDGNLQTPPQKYYEEQSSFNWSGMRVLTCNSPPSHCY